MTDKEKRRRRRNDHDRMRRKAASIAKSMFYPDYDEEWIKRFVCTHADNLAACSCSMCGNPRRSAFAKGKEKLTLQELRFLEDNDFYEWG